MDMMLSWDDASVYDETPGRERYLIVERWEEYKSGMAAIERDDWTEVDRLEEVITRKARETENGWVDQTD